MIPLIPARAQQNPHMLQHTPPACLWQQPSSSPLAAPGMQQLEASGSGQLVTPVRATEQVPHPAAFSCPRPRHSQSSSDNGLLVPISIAAADVPVLSTHFQAFKHMLSRQRCLPSPPWPQHSPQQQRQCMAQQPSPLSSAGIASPRLLSPDTLPTTADRPAELDLLRPFQQVRFLGFRCRHTCHAWVACLHTGSPWWLGDGGMQ